jgi:hypothetical protein
MKKLIFIGIGVLIISSISFAEIIKLNCVRTDYKSNSDDLLLIDLNKNIMKIKDLPDYRIRKITDDIIEADNNTSGTVRSLEFKRYTGKLRWIIFDLEKNKTFIDWYYQCQTARKII